MLGFELSGVDVVDTVGIHLDLAGENGGASVDLSVDPADLAETGLGVLGRAVGAADELQGLVGELNALMGETLVNVTLGQVEADINLVPGTLVALSEIDRDDLAAAMARAGVAQELTDLVAYATPDDIEMIDRGWFVGARGHAGARRRARHGPERGRCFGYGERARSRRGPDRLSLNLDPDVVRASAESETGMINIFMNLAESYFTAAGIDRALPDVGGALDRVSAVLGRELAQVEIVGADADAAAAGITLSLAADGGNVDLAGIEDGFSVSLSLDPETGNMVGGVSARDFLSVAQNLAVTDSAEGAFVAGLDGGALMSLTAEWLDGDVARSPFEGLGKGELVATVGVEDLAGNIDTATASDYIEGDFTLDTSADLGDAFTVSVAADDQVTNLAESTDVSLSLAGIDGDAASVSVEITDGTNTVNADATNDGSGWVVADQDLSGLADGALTVSATVTDQAGNSAPAVSASLTLDTSADLGDAFTVSVAADDQVTNAAESTDVSLSLAGIDGDAASVSVEISDGTNTVNADATNDGSGWVVADQDLSGLADGALTVSATVTDAAGNSAPAVSASLTLDTTADLGDDLTVSIDSVINDTESGTVQITLSGVDADVASPDGIVVTVGDPSTDTGALSAAQTAEADAESDLASLNSQLNTLVQIAGLEQLGVTELNITLGDLEGDEAGLQTAVSNAQGDYDTAYAEARGAFVAATADPDALTEGDSVVAPVTSPSISIDADAVAGGATWTQAQIDGLAADMDAFIASYTWPDAQGQTVDQLESTLNDANSHSWARSSSKSLT